MLCVHLNRAIKRDDLDMIYIIGPGHGGLSMVADAYHLSPDGRVMEVLSERQCQGWLEGYLLTGRHGFFSSYEAFSGGGRALAQASA